MQPNRQFYIYKFESSYLQNHKYKININFTKARQGRYIVSIADSQMLRSIRDIQNRYVEKEYIESLFQTKIKLQKEKSSEFNIGALKATKNEINKTMFVPEYVSVLIEHTSHYKSLIKNGLYVNGKKYVRFSCSASQARINTIIMVDESISDELYKRLNNGRKEVPLNPSKFNAYFGLSSSATHQVSTPRVCVIPDCIASRPTLVNWVTEIDEPLCDDIIEEKVVDFEYNYFDGMGLISPQQAEKWANELELDYTPAEWCIRNAFIKGMCCVFPYVEFCEKKNNGNYMIKTIYKDKDGNNIYADVRNYDLIITESQFKMWNCYDSYEQYEQNCIENKLYWGISKFSPKQDSNVLSLNYQSIQTLDLDDEDVKDLCQQTVDWIKGVAQDNILYTILFLMGKNINEDTINNFLQSSDKYWLKALIYNNDIIKDKYVSEKIYENISIKIKNACLGKINVDGNYQVLVSDPYALMEHATGQPVLGLLNNKEHYIKYWNDRGVDLVDSMRSPLTYRSEHNILNLKNTEEMQHWYRYLNTGVIVNVHGDDVIRWADSDFDMDIVATTSNKTVIKGVDKKALPVAYKKKTTAKKMLTKQDLYDADLLAFGSDIGQITNKSTSMYAMLPLFDKNSPERKEIEKRLIMTRVAQGNSIDKAKGVKVKEFPKHWYKYQHINEDDTEEVVAKKQLFNNILIEKRPYFFTYLYRTFKNQITAYNKKENRKCFNIFGFSLKELLEKESLDDKELQFVYNYNRYSPYLNTDCVMNKVCRHMEQMNLDIKQSMSANNSEFDYHIYLSDDKYFGTTKNQVLEEVKCYFKEFSNTKTMGLTNERLTYDSEVDKSNDLQYSEFKDRVEKICSNKRVLTNILVDIFYNDLKSKPKDRLWCCYGKYICENIKNNTKEKTYVPTMIHDGEFTYMGDKYTKIKVVE